MEQLTDWTKKIQEALKEEGKPKVCIPTVFTAASAVLKNFEETPYAAILKETGVITSYICLLMYMNNPDLYGKQMAGKALCLPRTIGSTTGGLVLYCACPMKRQPACMLFSEPIDSLAVAGAVLADVWLDDVSMPVVDSLGQEFLNYVKDDMTITVKRDGTVVVE